MPYKFDLRQKSPKRRFLLIIVGIAALIACSTLGLMMMFWDKLILKLEMTKTERYLFGSLFIGYGILRFSRLFKKEPEDEE